jgi:hypothetical protein
MTALYLTAGAEAPQKLSLSPKPGDL